MHVLNTNPLNWADDMSWLSRM